MKTVQVLLAEKLIELEDGDSENCRLNDIFPYGYCSSVIKISLLSGLHTCVHICQCPLRFLFFSSFMNCLTLRVTYVERVQDRLRNNASNRRSTRADCQRPCKSHDFHENARYKM